MILIYFLSFCRFGLLDYHGNKAINMSMFRRESHKTFTPEHRQQQVTKLTNKIVLICSPNKILLDFYNKLS